MLTVPEFLWLYGGAYLILCGLAAWFAESRGYWWWTWFVLSLLLTPILTFLVAAVIGRRYPKPS